MTIAVSTIVHPSRMLIYMLVLMLAFSNGIVAYITYQFEFKLTVVFALTLVFGVVSFLFALRFYRAQQVIQLDISDSGDIILRLVNSKTSNVEAFNVKLIDKSTFWSQLLLLHLRSDDQRVRVFTILPDCVDADTFRRLSVAVQWISTRTSTVAVLNSDISSGNF